MGRVGNRSASALGAQPSVALGEAGAQERAPEAVRSRRRVCVTGGMRAAARHGLASRACRERCRGFQPRECGATRATGSQQSRVDWMAPARAHTTAPASRCACWRRVLHHGPEWPAHPPPGTGFCGSTRNSARADMGGTGEKERHAREREGVREEQRVSISWRKVSEFVEHLTTAAAQLCICRRGARKPVMDEFVT